MVQKSRSFRFKLIAAVACSVFLVLCGEGFSKETPKAAPAEKGSAAAGEKGRFDPADLPKVSWTAEGKKAAEKLVTKIRAKGIACEGWEEGTFGVLDPKIAKQIPTPQAVMSCLGTGEEDITFEIFANADDANRYIDVKRKYLCRQTANNKLWFYPGFAYVLNGNWVIEPDELDTAEKIAEILGGTAARARCKGLWPTPKKKPAPPATPTAGIN